MSMWDDVFDKWRRRGYDLSFCADKADLWAYRNRCTQCNGHGAKHPYGPTCSHCQGSRIEPTTYSGR